MRLARQHRLICLPKQKWNWVWRAASLPIFVRRINSNDLCKQPSRRSYFIWRRSQRYSYVQPTETYEVNVMGTVHLLDSVRDTPGVRAVVNVTTDKCYENREWVWGYRENEAMGGSDPYSSSKGCSELVTSAYRQSFLAASEIALASARAGNVIGGGDWASDRLIPDFLRALDAGATLKIRSPPVYASVAACAGTVVRLFDAC